MTCHVIDYSTPDPLARCETDPGYSLGFKELGYGLIEVRSFGVEKSALWMTVLFISHAGVLKFLGMWALT